MNHNWQQFCFSLIAQLLLPLAPVAIEFWLTGDIGEQTITITAAMYSIAIGVSTKNLGILGLSIVVAVLYSSLFGFSVSGNNAHFSVKAPAILTIIFFMIIHAAERYKRHVKQGELFMDFGGKPNV